MPANEATTFDNASAIPIASASTPRRKLDFIDGLSQLRSLYFNQQLVLAVGGCQNHMLTKSAALPYNRSRRENVALSS